MNTINKIKINNMFKVKQNDIFAKNMSKLVSEYDKISFDKWMESLITKNGTTEY